MIGKIKDKNSEEIRNELIKIHYGKFDYSLVDKFESKSSFIFKVICNTCNTIFEPNLNNHLIKQTGCPNCARERRKSTYKAKKTIIDFNVLKNEFNIIHNYKYTYNENSFSRMTTEMEILCPIHGSFFQKPANHKKGKGCKLCGRESMKNKLKYSNEEISNLLKASHNYEFDITTYNGTKELMKFECLEHGEFWQRPMNQLRQYSGCPKCSTSKAEKELLNLYPFLKHRDRNIIHPLEIDLISEEYKFGIEFNGNLWHSFGKTFPNNYNDIKKDKHSIKSDLMEKHNYQLYHILDIDWENPIKKEIWLSVINSKIGNSTRIFARNTRIIDFTNSRDIVKDFLINNHLQGFCNYKVAYGLINKNEELIALMTFGKPIEDSSEWEIKRFCNLKNYSVIGGASKLLKRFEKVYTPNSIISYAKRDWSVGNLYNQLGFNLVNTIEPSKFYIKNNIKYSRQKFQKYKLKNRLEEGLLENLNGNTAEEILINNDYRIFYDAGNLKFLKLLKDSNDRKTSSR